MKAEVQRAGMRLERAHHPRRVHADMDEDVVAHERRVGQLVNRPHTITQRGIDVLGKDLAAEAVVAQQVLNREGVVGDGVPRAHRLGGLVQRR